MAFGFFRNSERNTPRGAAASGAPDASAQPTAATLAWDLHRRIDAAYEELGSFATVLARRVLDGVSAVLHQAGGEEHLDMRARVTLERLLEDYLPTTLRSYARATHDPETTRLLQAQLEQLTGAIEELLVAVREHNVQSLQIQGDFLDTKFTGSDLQL